MNIKKLLPMLVVAVVAIPAASAVAPGIVFDRTVLEDGTIILTATVPVLAGNAADETDATSICGGFAPPTYACTGGGVLHCCTFTITMSVPFGGFVRNVGGTSTGEWNVYCDNTPFFGTCPGGTIAGAFFVGQGYSYRGTADILTVGSWSAGVRNP